MALRTDSQARAFYLWNTETLEWEASTTGSGVGQAVSVENFPAVISGASVPVTGVFYPATQPVSVTGLPLPIGAATEAKQLLDNHQVSVSNFPATQPISGNVGVASSVLPSGAAVESKQEGLIERIVFNTLKRLNTDAFGRLRVSAESAIIASGTVTTVGAVTNITNWGLNTPTAKSQWESNSQFQSGFRRNLVHVA